MITPKITIRRIRINTQSITRSITWRTRIKFSKNKRNTTRIIERKLTTI